MQKHCKTALLFTLGCLLSTGQIATGQTLDSWSFSTLPASITGTPGETIGWGYTITNSSTTDWLWVLSVESSNPFTYATATLNPFDYPVLAPGMTLSVPYNGTAGLADLTWDTTAPIGFTDSGTFTATGYFYNNDPFNGGVPVGNGEDSTSAYSATVLVPESGTLGLLLAGLLAPGTAYLYRRRKAESNKKSGGEAS